MTICYVSSTYQSHLRTARAYCSIIRQKHRVVTNTDQPDPDRIDPSQLTASPIDAVILHVEPHDYARIYRRYPLLAQKYVVGYCVWEASELPAPYQRSLGMVQEVWTCSNYSARCFNRVHPNVHCIPHVAERAFDCSEQDRQDIRTRVGYDPYGFYFLTIARTRDRRKNVRELVGAFLQQSAAMPRARLIVKFAEDDPPPWVSHPQVLWLRGDLSAAHVNALYDLADAYVSAHHSEAWGLTLSDAMLAGKPVIATGYSGNLQFMNPDNSFLVRAREDDIRPEDTFERFTSAMQWGYPDAADLEGKLRLLYDRRGADFIRAKVENARRDMARFSSSTLAPLLHARLAAIESRTLEPAVCSVAHR